MTAEITENHLNRVKQHWEKIAKETVRIEKISDAIYGYCSELAALRLFHEYNKVTNNRRCRTSYSVNLKTHYFVLDL